MMIASHLDDLKRTVSIPRLADGKESTHIDLCWTSAAGNDLGKIEDKAQDRVRKVELWEKKKLIGGRIDSVQFLG